MIYTMHCIANIQRAKTFPFIVVDQNQLQSAESIASLLDRCRRGNLQILLPDVAGFEFSKSSNPHRTWSRCLEHLAPHGELIVVSRKLSHLWRDEMAAGEACTDLVERGATELIRQLLKQSADGDDSSIRALVDGPVAELLPASLVEWSNHDQFKAAVRVIYNSFKSSLPGEFIKKLRKTPEDSISGWMSSADGIRFIFQYIRSRDIDAEVALRLSVSASAMGAFVSGIAALALDWLAFGGFDGARSAEVTNDLNDLEYAALGALSVSLATNDKRPARICNSIKCGMQGRAQWFARALATGPENA